MPNLNAAVWLIVLGILTNSGRRLFIANVAIFGQYGAIQLARRNGMSRADGELARTLKI